MTRTLVRAGSFTLALICLLLLLFCTADASAAKPNASFSSNLVNGQVPLIVSFYDTSSNSPTSWSWSFGTGDTSDKQNPQYVYNSTGQYTVTLTATNADGSDTCTKIDYILVGGASVPVIFTTQTWGGYRISDVNITIYQNGTFVKNATTDSSGQAVFSLVSTTEYSYTATSSTGYTQSGTCVPVLGSYTLSFDPWNSWNLGGVFQTNGTSNIGKGNSMVDQKSNCSYWSAGGNYYFGCNYTDASGGTDGVVFYLYQYNGTAWNVLDQYGAAPSRGVSQIVSHTFTLGPQYAGKDYRVVVDTHNVFYSDVVKDGRKAGNYSMAYTNYIPGAQWTFGLPGKNLIAPGDQLYGWAAIAVIILVSGAITIFNEAAGMLTLGFALLLDYQVSRWLTTLPWYNDTMFGLLIVVCIVGAGVVFYMRR